MFHVHTCDLNEFVYFKLEKNFIAQLPETYLVITAPIETGNKTENGTRIYSKLFGSNKNFDFNTQGERFRPSSNDAQYEWETFNSSQVLIHYYNRRVIKSFFKNYYNIMIKYWCIHVQTGQY